MRQSSVMDIISPIMVGPSSSHTAGAVRLGILAKNIYNKKPQKVIFRLYNSYSLTGKGHGTDKGLLAGVLGFGVDDARIRNIFDMDVGIEYDFEFTEDFNRHPNAVDIIFEGDLNMKIEGDSVGAGRVVIRKINEFSVKFTGQYNTLLLVCKDVPGMISRITGLIQNVNITSLHCDRQVRGEEASMSICLDGDLDEKAIKIFERLENLYLVRYVEKLGS